MPEVNIGGVKITKWLIPDVGDPAGPAWAPGERSTGTRAAFTPLHMHGIYPRPVSRLRGGLFCFKEVMLMWIVFGYILCKVAKAAGCWRLYTATRHSFRSGRPGLFLQYWRM